jgi:hypothetical protein
LLDSMPRINAMKSAPSALLCSLLLLAPIGGQAAKVYKWTDAQGNVIYSDSPRPGAEEIEVPTEPAGIVPVAPGKMPPAGQAVPREGYGALIVASPSNEQVIEDPGGAVPVSLAVEPPLRTRDGDAVRLNLDGQPLDTRYTGAQIVIPGVPRGTHTLQAQVVDRAGTVLISSAPVTFHMHAPSSQTPAGPDIYQPTYPGQPYPPVYPPVYPPQPYPPQGRPKPAPAPR